MLTLVNYQHFKQRNKHKKTALSFSPTFAGELFSSKFITAQSENRMRSELTSGMQIGELLT